MVNVYGCTTSKAVKLSSLGHDCQALAIGPNHRVRACGVPIVRLPQSRRGRVWRMLLAKS